MADETVNRSSRWRVFWPEVNDVAGAHEAIRLAVWFAYVAAGMSAVAGLIGALSGGNAIGGLPGAVLFAALGFGIHRHFRTAAVLGAVLVVQAIVVALWQGSSPGAITPFVLIGFVNGVRGTFALHRLRAASGTQPVTPVPPSAPQDDGVIR